MEPGGTQPDAVDGPRNLLVSIQPKYANMIFSGEKRVELRRRRPRVGPGDRLIVYASAPTGALLGSVAVDRVTEKSPASLWPSVRGVGGVTRREFDAYFAGAPTAFGIFVSNPLLASRPISLADLRRTIPRFRPPQCYWYLRPDRTREGYLLNWLHRLT